MTDRPEPADGTPPADGAGHDADTPTDRPGPSLLFQRWQEPPPDLLTAERVAERRLADAMRSVIEQLVSRSASVQTIETAAEELERIAVRFEQIRESAEYEGYAEAANIGGDPHAMFEHSPVIGRANPLAPPMVIFERDAVVHGQVHFGSAYEGPPGCVHGGYVAAAFDELLGATQSMSGNPGMTGTLTIRYRSPTPLHADLRLEGRLLRVEGRKIFTEAVLYAGDRLCAEAEGIFISIDFSVLARLKAEREQAEGR